MAFTVPAGSSLSGSSSKLVVAVPLVWGELSCLMEVHPGTNVPAGGNEVSVSLLVGEGVAGTAGTGATDPCAARGRGRALLGFSDFFLDPVAEGGF